MSTYGGFFCLKGQRDVMKFVEKWDIKDTGSCKDIIDQYFDIYVEQSEGGKLYGRSSEDLLSDIAPIIIKENPKAILDYGCGRSSLISYFWNDGKRKLYKYDPALREYNMLTNEPVDVIICTDVLEHIPKYSLGTVMKTIQQKCKKVIFTVSLVPARKKLPNGENAHITIMPREFWIELMSLYFPTITIIKEDDKGMFFKTW